MDRLLLAGINSEGVGEAKKRNPPLVIPVPLPPPPPPLPRRTTLASIFTCKQLYTRRTNLGFKICPSNTCK